MKGREVFKIFRGLLLVLSKCIRIMPLSFRYFILNLVSAVPGKFGIGLRYVCLSSIVAKCGDNVYVGLRCTLKNIETSRFGSNVSIHDGSYLDGCGGLELGSDVSIAHQCSIITFEHRFSSDDVTPIKYQPIQYGPVIIDDDVWVGCGVRILAGTRLCSRSVIGAGAVVKGRFDGRVLLAGVPAKVVKRI